MLMTAASCCCSRRHVERTAPTHRLSAKTGQVEPCAPMVASIGTQTSIATTWEHPLARGLGHPCEVDLLGECSPLDCLDDAYGGRHDIDHDQLATAARSRPVDTDAGHAGNAMQLDLSGLDAPPTLAASSGRVLSELPPRSATEQTTVQTYTCNCARDWARHDDETQHEAFVRLLAVLMFLAATAVPSERGAPTSRAVTETVSSFSQANHVDVDVHTCGHSGPTPVTDAGGCCNKPMHDHTSGTANKQVTLTGGIVLRPGSAALLKQNQLFEGCSVDGPLAANCLRKRHLKRKRAQHEQYYDCGRVWLDNTTTTRSNIGANSAHNFQKSSPSNDAQRGSRHDKPKQGVDNLLCYSAECLVTHAAVENVTANCKPCLDDWSAIGIRCLWKIPERVAQTSTCCGAGNPGGDNACPDAAGMHLGMQTCACKARLLHGAQVTTRGATTPGLDSLQLNSSALLPRRPTPRTPIPSQISQLLTNQRFGRHVITMRSVMRRQYDTDWHFQN